MMSDTPKKKSKHRRPTWFTLTRNFQFGTRVPVAECLARLQRLDDSSEARRVLPRIIETSLDVIVVPEQERHKVTLMSDGVTIQTVLTPTESNGTWVEGEATALVIPGCLLAHVLFVVMGICVFLVLAGLLSVISSSPMQRDAAIMVRCAIPILLVLVPVFALSLIVALVERNGLIQRFTGLLTAETSQ